MLKKSAEITTFWVEHEFTLIMFVHAYFWNKKWSTKRRFANTYLSSEKNTQYLLSETLMNKFYFTLI